ncbi:MAG: YceH family protein [Fibrobacteres bacterium]|nr:YceH family protein [Fibrobacterota bacterium]
MNTMLTENQCRVLGALIEKELTTPDYYPLTLNSLTAACNQKSNRAPVVNYDEETVQDTLDELCREELTVKIPSVTTRTMKYRHNILAKHMLTPAELAIMCELLLRGHQTPGELRNRADRMHPFTSLDAVVEVLQQLSTREQPLVVMLPRQSGMKENRYAHLLSGDPLTQTATSAPSTQQRIDTLELEVAELKNGLEELKKAFKEFKAQF